MSCRFVEISRGGGSTRQPQRIEPCQCVSGQPWACHEALQGQLQPLQCAAGVVGPVLGAAAGPGRWFVGVAVLPVCGDFERRRQYSPTTAHRALPVCQCPALGMPWGKQQVQMQPLQCAVGVVEPALGAAAGLGRWFVGVAVLLVCGDFQRRRQHSATTAHRALPVCESPALGMP